MDKSSFGRKKGFLCFLVLMGMTSTSTLADVVMAPPEPRQPPPQADENYSPSRFGSPPLKPQIGVGPHYASQAVSEMQDSGPGEDSSSVDRRPAGLGFAQQPGQVVSTEVISENGMPHSMTNLNPKPSSSSRTGVQEIALIAGDLGFFPKTVFVTRDIPVRLFVTGASKKPLCIMLDSFQVRKQIRSQKIEEINFTPSNPGQYRFYCPVNGMEGTLLVKELTSQGE